MLRGGLWHARGIPVSGELMSSRSKFVLISFITVVVLAGGFVAWQSLKPSDDAESNTPVTEPGRAEIYPDGAQAEADISAALAKASKEKKRVLLDFGGNWCGDCQVLEIYFHDAANRGLLEANYVLVPVNIGRYDENLAIAARYGVPVTKGVPALAVLDADGKVVFSQERGEFHSMRSMDSASVTTFLQQYKVNG
jgi:thioredoxin 1